MRWGALVLAAACSGPTPRPAPPVEGAKIGPATQPPDSLVLALSNGYQLWFTAAREAQDTTGTKCRERSIEIRKGDQRRLVPLLYTVEAPVPLTESAVTARLADHCRSGVRYRIDLNTGRPTRLGPQ